MLASAASIGAGRAQLAILAAGPGKPCMITGKGLAELGGWLAPQVGAEPGGALGGQEDRGDVDQRFLAVGGAAPGRIAPGVGNLDRGRFGATLRATELAALGPAPAAQSLSGLADLRGQEIRCVQPGCLPGSDQALAADSLQGGQFDLQLVG